MGSPMPPLPQRPTDAPPQGFMTTDEPEPAAAQDQQEILKAKLEMFRSADETVGNLTRASNASNGAEYARAIKELLKKWMVDEVAAGRTSEQENPRILGA